MRVRGGVVAVAVAVLALSLPVRAQGAASPPFAFGGVIEGSYGPTWTHAARMSALEWMASRGLSMYIHAPKFDAYQRAQWRDAYPPGDLRDFVAEVRRAARLGVAWVPNVSPGFPLIPSAPAGAPSRDICFACPTDVAALEAKLDPFFSAGARTLMVSFDDVQKLSSHPEDAARYGNGATAYGHMTRDLLNTLQRRFQRRAGGSGFRLVTVLADYSGTADTEYLQAVRSAGGLDPGIVVLWTGTSVVAPTIRPAEAAAYARLVGRKTVGIWDNYPANDYAGNAAGAPVRMFLGPYEGRHRRLASAVAGIVVNVMNQPTANRFALGTLARYLAAPAAYDPEAAWRAAISDLAGGDPVLRDALAALAENSRSSSLNRRESVVFVPRRDAFVRALSGPFWTRAYDALHDELAREERAAAVIRQRLPVLAGEIPAFLERLREQASTAAMAAGLLAAQRPQLEAQVSLGAIAGRAAPPSPADVVRLVDALGRQHAVDVADPHYVHGDRLTPHLSDPVTVGGLYVNENRVDEFVGSALDATMAWLPAAPQAASGVTVTVDGRPVALAPNGRFRITVGFGHHVVVATDGSGNATGMRVVV